MAKDPDPSRSIRAYPATILTPPEEEDSVDDDEDVVEEDDVVAIRPPPRAACSPACWGRFGDPAPAAVAVAAIDIVVG